MLQPTGGSRPPQISGVPQRPRGRFSALLKRPASKSFPQRRGGDQAFAFGTSPVACKSPRLSGGNRRCATQGSLAKRNETIRETSKCRCEFILRRLGPGYASSAQKAPKKKG